MILTDLGLAPPGGWKFTEGRTGWTGTAITFQSLVHKVVQHRTNMGFEAGNVVAEVQEWICANLTEEDRRIRCAAPGPAPKAQPGDVLSAVIFQTTGRYAQTCGKCVERMRQMNTWGWWGCWRHRQEIVSWLAEEARARGHVVTDDQIWSLFRAALREVAH